MTHSSGDVVDIRFLPSSLLLWGMSATVFLPLAALAAVVFSVNEAGLAYLSAGLTFFSAFLAGIRAIRIRRKNAVVTALIVGTCLILLSLTLGFVIDAERMTADGILSVVSFSYCGAMVGCVLFRDATRRVKHGHGA